MFTVLIYAVLILGFGTIAYQIGHNINPYPNNCPYCDERVSPKSERCPHCGNKLHYDNN